MSDNLWLNSVVRTDKISPRLGVLGLFQWITTCIASELDQIFTVFMDFLGANIKTQTTGIWQGESPFELSKIIKGSLMNPGVTFSVQTLQMP